MAKNNMEPMQNMEEFQRLFFPKSELCFSLDKLIPFMIAVIKEGLQQPSVTTPRPDQCPKLCPRALKCGFE